MTGRALTPVYRISVFSLGIFSGLRNSQVLFQAESLLLLQWVSLLVPGRAAYAIESPASLCGAARGVHTHSTYHRMVVIYVRLYGIHENMYTRRGLVP